MFNSKVKEVFRLLTISELISGEVQPDANELQTNKFYKIKVIAINGSPNKKGWTERRPGQYPAGLNIFLLRLQFPKHQTYNQSRTLSLIKLVLKGLLQFFF